MADKPSRTPLGRIKFENQLVDLETGLVARCIEDGRVSILLPGGRVATVNPPAAEAAWELLCQDARDLEDSGETPRRGL